MCFYGFAADRKIGAPVHAVSPTHQAGSSSGSQPETTGSNHTAVKISSRTRLSYKQICRRSRLKICSQNCQGLSSHTKFEALVDTLLQRNVFACGVQELWRVGKETLRRKTYTALLTGESTRSCNRGSFKGVGIFLNKLATDAWRRAQDEGPALSEVVL